MELQSILKNHGIHKIARQNCKNPLFDAALIRRIIQNPVYSGKISYGRRRTEKVHGTRNEYRQVKKDDYLLVDGLHEALVSEEVWEQAQVKVAAQAKKYEKVNRDKREKIHLLSEILKCPVCGAGMYGKTDLENHLYKTYDKIDEAEELLVSAKIKKRSLLADKITGDNIYKAFVFFDKLYAQMNEAEKREFLSQLVDNVQIYEERKENG